MSDTILSFNGACGCGPCLCPNRAWRIAGHTYSAPDSTWISAATLAATVEGYDFTGKPLGFYAEIRGDDGLVFEYPLAAVRTLKIQNHQWTEFFPVVDYTRYTMSAGWFKPSGDYYWKTVIAKVGQHVSPVGNTFGIFADPVLTKVSCTPNEIIEFGLPPLGETWIIADCEDDYNYVKMPRDLELCLRSCVGDSSTIWSQLCIAEFQTTPEEVAAYGGGCDDNPIHLIQTCMSDYSQHARRGRNSIWDC